MGKIVIIGDSVGASANVILAQRWFQIVALANGYSAQDIINSCIPGNKSSDMLPRYSTDVMAYDPDVVAFLMTVNDAANGVSIADSEAHYRSMMGPTKDLGKKMLVITPPIYRQNVASWRPWHAMWQKLAADYDCHLIDITRAYGWEYVADVSVFNAMYISSPDLVHQSVAGNARMAAICCEPTNTGAFVKSARPIEVPGGGCPDCPSDATELQLASEDLLANGATVSRLERLRAALPAL